MHQDRGNILFLILLAIILFVALSYAVMGSINGGGSKKGQETFGATFATMRNTSSQIIQGINRLKLMKDCTDTKLSFEHPSFLVSTNPYNLTLSIPANSDYSNANAPVTKECHLFDPAGAGLSPPTNISAGQGGVSSLGAVYQIRTGNAFKNVGTTATDIFMMVGPLNDDFCDYINNLAGISSISSITNLGNSVPAKGDLTLVSNVNNYPGKEFFCYNNYSPTQNFYVEVVLPR